MAKTVRIYMVLGILIGSGFGIAIVLDILPKEQATELASKSAMVWAIMFAATVGLKLVTNSKK